MSKTPDYIKKAVNDYRKNYDFIQLRFRKELNIKEKLKEKGNTNDYITNLVLKELGIKSSELEQKK